MHNPIGWVDPFGLAKCNVIKASSRKKAIQKAKEFSQVPRVSKGGKTVSFRETKTPAVEVQNGIEMES